MLRSRWMREPSSSTMTLRRTAKPAAATGSPASSTTRYETRDCHRSSAEACTGSAGRLQRAQWWREAPGDDDWALRFEYSGRRRQRRMPSDHQDAFKAWSVYWNCNAMELVLVFINWRLEQAWRKHIAWHMNLWKWCTHSLTRPQLLRDFASRPVPYESTPSTLAQRRSSLTS